MKAHLGNPNIHSDYDRAGINFNNRNKKTVGKRKCRSRQTKRGRKRFKLREKKSFVDHIIESSIKKGEEKNHVIDEVISDFKNKNILLRKDAVLRYLSQKSKLSEKFESRRKSVDGAGKSGDKFLLAKSKEIENYLLVIRRIPNITMELFFRFISMKYPEWCVDEDDESDIRKRYYRFENFMTKNKSGLQWNTGRPQGRDATTELLKARAVYFTEKEQQKHAKTFNLKD